MVALTGVGRGFHIPQQRVHFIDRQLAVGAHGGMAGRPSEQPFLAFAHDVRAAEVHHVGNQIADHLFDVRGPEQGRDFTHDDAGRPCALDRYAERAEFLGATFDDVRFGARHVHRHRHQQTLGVPPPRRATAP